MGYLRVTTGLERLIGGAFPELAGARTGLILHPASVSSELTLAVDGLLAAGYGIDRLFGPQHGARGEKQDNMIESEHYTDPITGLPVHSLYSEVRKPTPEMLEGLDAVLFDLQDVGVRVYTFVWTMALAMEACAEAGVRFVVLDRPNPIGGLKREGPLLQEGFESFVGLHPIPLRHGLTAGELARWLAAVRGIDVELTVVECEGLRRWMTWDDTGLPYVMPSPNLPTPDSCDVYPGMVLVEGTNLSEGRGTTRPFELFGAPFLDGVALSERVGRARLRGVELRPCWFEPTFQKHAGVLCSGAQVHVTDRTVYDSVRTTVEIFAACREQAPEAFQWRPPPYEYEETLMPIDILWGSDRLRRGIDGGQEAEAVLDGVDAELGTFTESVEEFQLYD